MLSTSKSSPANCRQMAPEEEDSNLDSEAPPGLVTFHISGSITEDGPQRSEGCSMSSVDGEECSTASIGPDQTYFKKEDECCGRKDCIGKECPLGAQWRHVASADNHVHTPECHWNRHGPLLPCPNCNKPEHECHPGPPSPQLRRPTHAPSDCPCHAPGGGTDPLHCRCQCHVDRAASSPNIDSSYFDHLQALRMQYN